MQNLLRTYRKKSELSIEDVSRLLNLPDSSKLSRCERGYRRPCLEVIFTYQILFEARVERLFENEMKSTYRRISDNIDPLISELEKQEKSRKIDAKIVFLKSLKELIIKKI